MKRFLGFGLILALAISLMSCHQTGFPDGGIEYADRGSTSGGGGGDGTGNDGFIPPFPPPNGGGGVPGGNIPDWETGSPSNPGGRMTVAEQLEWLRNNAQAGSGFNVWAWQTPNETLNGQEIHGRNGAGIRVLMQSYYAAPRLLQLGAGGDTMFTMGSNSTLYIQNLELQGTSDNNDALVRVNDGGTFFMGIFSEVRNSHIGVRILNGGSLTMDRNSAIKGSRLNGVQMNGGRSRFVMEYDSSVSGTLDATDSAAVLVSGHSNMIMKDRSRVTGNSGRTSVMIRDNGKLSMNDRSSISANSSIVRVATGGYLEMNDYAAIYNNIGRINDWGSGVHLSFNGTLTMNDNARIGNNVFEGDNGGGAVVLNDSLLIMNGRSRIHNNVCHISSNFFNASRTKVTSGGVTILVGGKLRMYDNSRIENNQSNYEHSPGGVFLTSGRFYMNGNASIRGNHARQTGGIVGTPTNNVAGGVMILNGTLTINGGLIYGADEQESNRTRNANNALFIAGAGTVELNGGSAQTISGPVIRQNTVGVRNGNNLDGS